MTEKELNINEIEKVSGGKIISVTVKKMENPSPSEQAAAYLIAAQKLKVEERRRWLEKHAEQAARFEVLNKRRLAERYNNRSQLG